MGKLRCPKCQYETDHEKQMRRHHDNTGHGRAEKRKRWKGHKQTGKNK